MYRDTECCSSPGSGVCVEKIEAVCVCVCVCGEISESHIAMEMYIHIYVIYVYVGNRCVLVYLETCSIS